MGIYILGLLHLCKRWWFALLMSAILWYCIYQFFINVDGYLTQQLEWYRLNLGMQCKCIPGCKYTKKCIDNMVVVMLHYL